MLIIFRGHLVHKYQHRKYMKTFRQGEVTWGMDKKNENDNRLMER